MADREAIRVLAASGDSGVIEDFRRLLVASADDGNQSARVSLDQELFGLAVRHEDFPKVDLVTCRQGAEAVQAVRGALNEEQPFAVAFVDMSLGAGFDGLQTIEQIRGWDPRIHIVILAVGCDVHPLDVCKRVPPADRLFFLQKPFHPLEIQQLVFALNAKWRGEVTGLATRRPAVVPQIADVSAALAAIQHQPMATMAFDRGDELLAANPELLRLFPELADVLAAGMSYAEVQRLMAERLLPEDTVFLGDAWLRDRLNWHAHGGGLLEQKLAGDRWILLNERVGANEITYCHYLDITEIRKRDLSRTTAAHMTAIAQSFAGLCERLDVMRSGSAGSINAPAAIMGDPQIAVLHTRGPGSDQNHSQGLTQKLQAVAQRLKLNPKPVKLSRLVGETVREQRANLPDGIELEVIESAGLWEVMVDEAAVAMALVELISNAAEAMTNGGRLVLETANARLTKEFAAERSGVSAGDYVRLMVRDSGAGMSPDLAERALNPFFTSKAASGHEGLGLSVAYGVVCQSGGHMEIENGEGDGAKVDLYFPRSTGVSGTSDADVHIVSPKRRSAG